MVLNYIWVAFFVIAFIVALIRLLFMGDTEIFTELVNSTFDSSKNAFEISLGLTGVLALWLGIMKIGENSGMINSLSRWLSPLFCRLFPDIPKGHPAMGSIFMNLSANMLGLDNAATPLGLKAMKELQELNPKKDTATNPMIMFLVMNTSGLILIPVSIMMYRAQMGAVQPTDIFIPTLLTTTISTLVGVAAVSISQRLNLFCKPVLILGHIFYTGSQYNPVQYHPAFYRVGTSKKDQRLRRFYRRSKRRVQHCRAYHSLSGSFPCRNCRIPCFGCNGYAGKRHWLSCRPMRHRHQLCWCPAHCPDEVAEWKRSQWPDDRYHERIRS